MKKPVKYGGITILGVFLIGMAFGMISLFLISQPSHNAVVTQRNVELNFTYDPQTNKANLEYAVPATTAVDFNWHIKPGVISGWINFGEGPMARDRLFNGFPDGFSGSITNQSGDAEIWYYLNASEVCNKC